ncbi:CDP-alcohol phosphatidyltransferase family protein [Patescibacteria group bacterium]|nr:CDP-alcohol phosphatidyltransferase family protein [Patescibacteria group bacterium]
MNKPHDPHKVQRHDYVLKYTVLPLIPKFVTPNQVTVLRMILTPVVLYLLVFENYAWGVPLFFLTAFTDAVDGSMARVRKQVTDWGSVYDPVADKLLISSVVILVVAAHINVWLALVIVALDLLHLVGGFIRKHEGLKVQANLWGKIKMSLQVAGVMALLIALWLGLDLFIPYSAGAFYLAIGFAVISLYTHGV